MPRPDSPHRAEDERRRPTTAVVLALAVFSVVVLAFEPLGYGATAARATPDPSGGLDARARLGVNADEVAVVEIGPGAPSTLRLPAPADDVLCSDLEAYDVRVDADRVSIAPSESARLPSDADLFLAFAGTTYALELRYSSNARPREIELFDRAPDGARAPISVASAPRDASVRVPPVILVDGGALALPPVVTAAGRMTRIALPAVPVNLANRDPEAFGVELRGRDLYVTPALGAGREAPPRGRLQVYMNGGAVYDFELRVGSAGRHHHLVIVCVSDPPARRILRRATRDAE